MAAFLRKPVMLASRNLLRTFSSSTAVEKASSSSSSSSSSSFREVKSALRSEHDPDKLVEIFQKSADCPRFWRDRSVFDISIRKLYRSQRFDLIERILEHQKQCSALKSEGFWIRIMMLYSQAGMFDQAVCTFHQMEELGCKRTEKSLCALLSVCLENRRYDLVHESLESIPSKIGVSPGIIPHNLVLRAFCYEKSIESARTLLGKLETEKKVKPDINSYNVLLGAYLRAGDDAKFDEILKEIPKKGLKPNVATYNYRLLKLCRAKECVRAKKLLDEMASKGVKPNTTSYNVLIEGYCKTADFESAKKIMETMKTKESVAPNPDTYFTFVRCFVQEEEFDSALAMCKESLEKNWIPPFESMKNLVNGLVKSNKADKAKEIVEEMKKRFRGSAAESWKEVEEGLLLPRSQ